MSQPGPRVLLVTAEFPPTPGGVGDYTARLATALAESGALPAVVTGRAAATAPLASHEDVLVWRLVRNWGWGSHAAIERAAAAWQADIVHVQYQTGAYGMHPAINALPWLLRRHRHQPVSVTTFHDTRAPYLFPRAGRARGVVNAALARGSDLTIATNPTDEAALGGLARRLALIPIGPNIEPDAETDALAARARAEANLVPNEHLLLTFGLLNHSKGLPTLLRALALLNHERATGRYRLALVGAGDGGLDPTDRSTAAELRQMAADLGVADALLWVGPRPAAEVAGWLRAADAVALPYVDGASYRRGTLLAALACGAAVVTTTPVPEPDATKSGILPRLVSGRHVLLTPPEQPADLATALAAAAGDAWLNRGLRLGASKIAAHFTWPAIAARTRDAYLALLKDRA